MKSKYIVNLGKVNFCVREVFIKYVARNPLLPMSMKFFSPEVALYFYKSTTWPCLEYCYHLWDAVSRCYLEMLDKLGKWIRGSAGPSLANAFLGPISSFKSRITDTSYL